MKKIIERPQYLKTLLSWQNKADTIKIITGIRRCGKSSMFKIFQKYMLNNGILPSQIQTINFEDADFSDLLDWKKLHDYLKSRLIDDKMNYIFLDEIQNVPDFERAVNSLRLQDNIDLYLTGSNSRILSGELATLLSGRYVTIQMFTLSFREYISAYPFAMAKDDIFQDYLRNSGFPYAIQMTAAQNPLLLIDAKWDTEQIRLFLKGLFDTIVLKDIVERKNVKDVSRLTRIIKFMFDNIGSETSVRNIKNMLETEGLKIDAATIENYLDGLLDAFVMHRASRYDIKGKQHLKTNAKYYLADIGLRYFLLGREGDVGHILENVVYLELLRRGYEVSIGKINDFEVDFVAAKNGSVEYYQVSQELSSKATRDRELKALDAIKNHNPKYLLTMDKFFAEEYRGIRVLNALDWLCD
ncbi:MAG: ATP-binding protein [Fibromonadaceae bacterium]|nr:ATP-binding protein [Fibromonadaceae bacterium]